MYHACKQVESSDPTGVATPIFSHPRILKVMTSSPATNSDERVQSLIILRKGEDRYLVNTGDEAIRRLQYATATLGENYISSVPTFEIESIPPLSGVHIEEVDRFEDGTILWQISEVDWDDGIEYRGTEKRSETRSTPVDWTEVDREKTKVDEQPPQRMGDES
jgi:hypothetical protein